MDIVQRLRVLLCVLLLGWCGSSFAYTYTITSHGVTGTAGNPYDAAAKWASAYTSLGRVACTSNGVAVAWWQMTAPTEAKGLPAIDYAGRTVGIRVTPSAAGCGNSAIDDRVAFTFSGTNTCSGPDQLVTPCAKTADQVCAELGNLGGAESKWVYKGTGLSTCRGDCVFIPESSGYDKTTGYTIAWGRLINQGLACGSTAETESTGYSEADANKPAEAPHAGEKGYCPGQISGTTVWVKCGSTSEVTSTSEKATQTDTSASGVSSTGTTTTGKTTKTSCDGSNCTTTTTTTTTNADGSKTDKSETKTEAQQDYCKVNPTATACKDAGSFGGSCAGGFSCEGDAVQCAIARENYKRNCELFENETAESRQGKTIANGQARPDGHPGNSPETVNVSGNIDQTNPYGGTCPPDINLSVYGKTVTIPVSNACDIFKWMGYIAVAFTMYAAARITMGGVSA